MDLRSMPKFVIIHRVPVLFVRDKKQDALD